jgi:hypothetical protein
MSIEDVLNSTYEDIKKNNNNYNKSKVNTLISKTNKIIYSLFFVSLLGLGYNYFNHKHVIKDAEKDLKNKIANIIDEYQGSYKIDSLVKVNVDTYFTNNPSLIKRSFKSSSDSIIDNVISNLKNELLSYANKKIENKAEVLFEEEIKKIEKKNITNFNEVNVPSNTISNNVDNIIEKNLIPENKNNNDIKIIEKKEPNFNSSSRIEEIANSITNISNDYNYLIYVDKDANKTYLLNLNSNKIINEFNSIDGNGRGPKTRNNDGRTPEGIYNITYVRTASENSYQYDPLYGTVRIGFDYPNNYDRSLGRYGQGLLICGTGKSERINAINQGRDISYGSVVLKNEDIEKLYSKIDSNLTKTIIVIESPSNKLSISNYRSDILKR